MVADKDCENEFDTLSMIKMIGLMFAAGLMKFMTAWKKYCMVT